MGSFKMCVTQERGEGRLTQKVTKNYAGEGSQPKNVMPLTQKKKNEILRVTFFLMLTYFAVFFVSVFADDVISFL